MPEIKNTFLKGRMNKDLDERLIPNGEYRDALNVKVSTSESSEVGTIQTILGNERTDDLVPNDHVCVGSVADEKTNKLYWFTKTSSVDLILEYDQKTNISQYVFVDTKTNTDDAVLKFPDKLITGINIIDNLLFWTDGISEPKKINISNCIQGTIQDPTTALINHTKLVVKGQIVLDANNNQVDIKEENITVIKKKPTKAPVTNIIYSQTSNTNNDKNSLFEKTFSRFCLRYKYEDGEYSAFGPFSDVVFNPQYVTNENYNIASISDAKVENYTRKEPFNRSMVNKIDTIQIFDFIAPDMPNDVVEVEILYKQEDLPNIYSIAKLDRDDTYWNNAGFNEGSNISNSEYSGRYDLLTENIYAVLPENQFIRVFDNVPKNALAQEVTGNRIVYGNYTQNYDVSRFEYNHDVGLQERISTDYSSNSLLTSDFDFGPQKSLKSLRNYQVGIVFGDKYGRETPVFTTERAALSIPWEDQNNGYNASRSLSLFVDYNSSYPTWADYFKYYIKETSSEYYNLLMDKAYIPTSQDDVDRNQASDHIWLSFFSSDRNKVKEEDHIILKKIFGSNAEQVTKNNKFKIIDIKNEAPDSIKFDYKKLYIEVDDVTYNDIIDISGQRLTDTTSIIRFDGNDYINAGGYDFLSTDRTGNSPTEPQFKVTDHYISWKDISSGQTSARYRVDNVVTVTGGDYRIKLDKEISTADAQMAAGSGNALGGVLDTGLQIQVERKQERELDQFSGRFFVKIAFNQLASDIQDIIPDLITAFTPLGSFAIRHLMDEIDGAELDPSLVAVNNDNAGATSYTGAGEDVINGVTLGSGITNTEADWSSITGEISNGVNQPSFFIDAMYYCSGALGTGTSAGRTGDVQKGAGEGGDPAMYTYVSWTDKLMTYNQQDPVYYPWNAVTDGGQNIDVIGKVSKNFFPYGKYTNQDNYWLKISDNVVYSGSSSSPAAIQNQPLIPYSLPSGAYNSPVTYDAEDESPDLDKNWTIVGTAPNAYAPHSMNYSNPQPLGGDSTMSNMPANPPKYRWFPLDQDAYTEGGYNVVDNYSSVGGFDWRGFVIRTHPDAPTPNTIPFTNIPSNLDTVNNPFIGWGSFTTSSQVPYFRYFEKSYYQDPNLGIQVTNQPDTYYGRLGTGENGVADATDTVNALEGFIVSTSEHTSGSRTWKSSSINLATTAPGQFVQDNTYGVAGEEGKYYLHISFLAPGKNLTDASFSIPSTAGFQGTDCLGAYLQGIHGGGVFTKSFKEAADDSASAFDGTNNWDSARTIHCESSSVNSSKRDIGNDPNFQTISDDQWDPTKTPYGDPGGDIAAFIDKLTTANSHFKFADDPNNTFYKILSTSVKKLYNHTPWKRRYIRDVNGSAPDNAPYTDLYNLNGDNIGAGDSVEEAAVAWAKAKATNDATEATKLSTLESKIRDFGRRNNRRIVYIIELDKDPTDNNVNGGFNPFDADGSGSNITANNSNAFLEFISTTPDFAQGSSSVNPAIWETEPQKNTDLDIYYEASKAIPLKLNNFNRELLANVGCNVVSSLGVGAINPGVQVYLQSWKEQGGEQIVTLTPGFNAFNIIGAPINYENSTITFINKDSSFVEAKVVPSSIILPPLQTPTGGFVTELSIKIDHPSKRVGLSWYNCFNFGNGIESNRIRDDFNQMQITNGARASATLEEPYSVEEKKNGLIYSGIYNSISNINNLNQFIAGEKITKDLNPTYGSIQKLFQRRISLVAFCEDKVVSIVSNKDALFNADGNSQLVSTDKVLGDATPFVGDYGISKNPESFAKESYRAYFTDKNRGAVLRLSKDGITPISQAGMHDWFRDHLPLANNILGSYDEYNQDYNLSLIIDLPSYNLIDNSYLTYGQAEILELLESSNFIHNGSMNQATNTNFPAALPWQSGSFLSNPDSNGVGLLNQDLISNVRIIRHEAIPEGHYYAGITAGDPGGSVTPGDGLPGDPGAGFQAYQPPTYDLTLADKSQVGSSSLIPRTVYGYPQAASINVFALGNPFKYNYVGQVVGTNTTLSSPFRLGNMGIDEAYIVRYIDGIEYNGPVAGADFHTPSQSAGSFSTTPLLNPAAGASMYVNTHSIIFAPDNPSDYYNTIGGFFGIDLTAMGSGFILRGKAPNGSATQASGQISHPSNGTVGDNISSSYNSSAHSIITSDPGVSNNLATDLTVFKGETIIVEYELMCEHMAVDANGDEVVGFDYMNYGWQDGALVNSSITDSGGSFDNPAESFTGQTYPLPNGGVNGTSLGSAFCHVTLLDKNNSVLNIFNPVNGIASTGPGNSDSLFDGTEAYYESYGDTVNNNTNSWITEGGLNNYATWFEVGNGSQPRCKVRKAFKFNDYDNVTGNPDTVSDLIVIDGLRVGFEFGTSTNMVPRAGHGTTATKIVVKYFLIRDVNVYKGKALQTLHSNEIAGANPVAAIPPAPPADIPMWHEIQIKQPAWSTPTPALVDLHAVATSIHGPNTGTVSTNTLTYSMQPNPNPFNIPFQTYTIEYYVDPGTNTFGTANTMVDGTPYTLNEVYKSYGPPGTQGPQSMGVFHYNELTYDDNIEVVQSGSSLATPNSLTIPKITQTLVNPYVTENYYLLDLVTTKTATQVATSEGKNWNHGAIGVKGNFEATEDVNTLVSVWGEQPGYPGYPYFQYGRVRGPVGSRHLTCVSIDPTKDASNDNWYSNSATSVFQNIWKDDTSSFINIGLPILHSKFNYANYAPDTHILRSIFKVSSGSNLANSANGYNNNELTIEFYNTTGGMFDDAGSDYGAINKIRLIDLSNETDTHSFYTKGTVNSFRIGNTAYQPHLMVAPRMYVYNNVVYLYGITQGALWSGDHPAFTTQTIHATFQQRYANPSGQAGSEAPILAPTASTDGYEFRFTVHKEHFSNEIVGNPIIKGIGYNGLGFQIHGLTNPGRYRAILDVGSLNDPLPNNTPWAIEYDPLGGVNFQPVSASTTISTFDNSSTAIGSWGRWQGCINITAAASNALYAFGLSNFSLSDQNAQLIPSSAQSWSFVQNNEANIIPMNGFEWNNGSLIVNSTSNNINTPGFPHAVQHIGNLPLGTRIRFRVSYEELGLTNGILNFIYVNDNMQGFMIQAGTYTGSIGNTASGAGPNYHRETWATGSNGVYEVETVIQNFNPPHPLSINGAVISGSYFYTNQIPAVNSLIILTDSQYGSGSGPAQHVANYSLDNFSMTPFTPMELSMNKTITFSEDVGGWVSFKSFTPESALSLSKKYYTFNQGGLYQHDVTTNGYNNFYGVQFDSSVTAVLNSDASTIKSFKTLGYEGSKSHVTKFQEASLLDFETGNTINLDSINNSHINNIEAEVGWYVESIFTDKQDGFIDEFIEKEGKWFNYIKGGLQTVDQDYISRHTGDFSFQGLGEISSVQDITPPTSEQDEVLLTGTPASVAGPTTSPVLPATSFNPPPSGTPGGGGTTIY
tara:strand:- start:12142 stop:22377 length:10236 start_codon:yes stop_codon:yes gene_type:complete